VDSLDTDKAERRRDAPGPGAADAADSVTALYQAHAVGLIRLAIIMLGDRAAAEDVVQDAFLGLYRHWDGLSDTANALTYVRSSVLNRCRSVLKQLPRRDRRDRAAAASGELSKSGESAEASVLLSEEHREMLAAIRTLPDRQREALVLRFYLDMSEEETAHAMRISRGTVKSATSRAITTLGRMLKESS
jgi:RNA polymerase sigma-70 factor (sigma-E family)